MNGEAPILPGMPATDEQKRLVAAFDEMERKQVRFIDTAAKRIIELCTTLLGVLFAVTAFGAQFPPPYLKGNNTAKALAIATLAWYVGAMLVALWAAQPREYLRYEHNVTEMRKVWREIVAFKSRTIKAAGVLFVLGSLTLALLIGSIILAA